MLLFIRLWADTLSASRYREQHSPFWRTEIANSRGLRA
jgi:hypothetical protein